jgi:hypothetical protein
MKDVRKGTMVILRNGWKAKVEDNATNRSTRMCTVYGTFTEMGSVYSTDISEAQMADGTWHDVVHPVSKLKAAKARAAWGF